MATDEQIRNYAHQLWERAGVRTAGTWNFGTRPEVELNAESESPDAPSKLTQANNDTPPG
jgi:hypothetical protein